MKHNIDDLRDHLFDTLKALRDEKNPMDLERARTVATVAKVIVDSAKVEVAMLEATGGMNATGFIPDDPNTRRRPTLPGAVNGNGAHKPV
jgi:hypothetical protein